MEGYAENYFHKVVLPILIIIGFILGIAKIILRYLMALDSWMPEDLKKAFVISMFFVVFGMVVLVVFMVRTRMNNHPGYIKILSVAAILGLPLALALNIADTLFFRR